MVFFYLTTLALDIAFGTIYWIGKKTKDGVCYLVYSNSSDGSAKLDEDLNIEKLKLLEENRELMKKVEKQNLTIQQMKQDLMKD